MVPDWHLPLRRGHCGRLQQKEEGASQLLSVAGTVAQTGQVFNGCTAPTMCMIPMVRRRSFCLIERVREALPGIIIEVRMDGAFFSDDIVSALDQAHIEYRSVFRLNDSRH